MSHPSASFWCAPTRNPEYTIFGRNEPALHHYHNTYREALGMEPLELLPG